MEQVRAGLTAPRRNEMQLDVIGEAIWSIEELALDCSIDRALWSIDISRCTSVEVLNPVDYGRSGNIKTENMINKDDTREIKIIRQTTILMTKAVTTGVEQNPPFLNMK